ncbi:hypothetical protein F4779DRAFT_609758 [Xylariaceae sp. FL0662B]|nr:hypothetical protein F4779DRAFT_609758 [Xylariaceae sp. FL0662B]
MCSRLAAGQPRDSKPLATLRAPTPARSAPIQNEENTRESSETAFLHPHSGVRNPDLITFPSTLAKQVLFDRQKRTIRILGNTQGLQYTIRARKGVIFSASASQSPQLLIVSDIEPKGTLQQHSIEIIQDSHGVRHNMRDHILFRSVSKVDIVTSSALGNPALEAEFEKQYTQQGPDGKPRY